MITIDDCYRAMLVCDEHPDCVGCVLEYNGTDVGEDICFRLSARALELAREGRILLMESK
jgi:hypothetical protein